MSFTIVQDEAAVRGAQRFQLHANLEEVCLLDCGSKTEDEADGNERELRLALHVDSALSRREGEQVWISVRVGIAGKRKDGDNPVFEANCRYSLRYRLAPGYDASDDEIEAFREGNAIFHSWPYSRELLQNLAMRMGMYIPALPLLRLGPRAAPGRKQPGGAGGELGGRKRPRAKRATPAANGSRSKLSPRLQPG